MTRTLNDDPLFRLENHGTLHAPLSVNGQSAYGIAGTSSPAEAIDEIEVNRELLRSYGADSTWFRSGTAHYDDVAVQIARGDACKTPPSGARSSLRRGRRKP